MLRNTCTRYGLMARFFHWFAALTVLGGLLLAELFELFPRGSAPRTAMVMWHINAGVLTGLLVLPRLLWRLNNAPPDITPPPGELVRRLAHAMHMALYLLMMVMPLLGVLMLQAGGRQVALFGWTLPLPALLSADPGLRRVLRGMHGLIGHLMLLLVLLHIAAALWHHFKVRDDTLRRMLGR